jgi:hypothetical protein
MPAEGFQASASDEIIRAKEGVGIFLVPINGPGVIIGADFSCVGSDLVDGHVEKIIAAEECRPPAEGIHLGSDTSS